MTIMYVETHASARASPFGSWVALFPRVQYHAAAQSRTIAAATLERIVKKLKKFAAVVARSRPRSAEVDIDVVNWAITATRMATASTSRSAVQTVANVPERRFMSPL
ncbi:hypothetical protein [Microbacterium elymi]|uniref:hypothetical protein n=1 Tax=Microbacterium elymi TaxID=2909587 RepID=UPI00338EE488